MAEYGLPAASRALLASTRPLPTGACSHRDVATGSCGCEQFWDKLSTELHEGSKEHRPSSERSTWCVCGHHACFHKVSAVVAPRPPAKCDGRCRSHASAHCDLHRPLKPRRDERLPPEGSHPTHHGSLIPHSLPNDASQANGSSVNPGHREVPSQPSTSGFPRIPSMCLLSNDRYPLTTTVARDDANQSHGAITGLGLSVLNIGTAEQSRDRRQSNASTVPDEFDIGRLLNGSHSETRLPSTRANSVAGEHAALMDVAPGALVEVLPPNRILHVDVSGDTIPNTYNPEEFIQSATEVATPSNANTPDLAAAFRDMHEGTQLVEALIRVTSNITSDVRPAGTTSAPVPQLLPNNSPSANQEQLQKAIKSASPRVIQQIIPYLAPLHNLLKAIPNVANTMAEHNDRLALLENNNSFHAVHPDEFQQQYEMLDTRLIELENRLDEHDKLHQAIDADHSSQFLSRRQINTVTGSFGSNCSVQSTTSSALIVAAMDRKEMETEIGGIKTRLDMLEDVAMPTSNNPWEVEVVLLPWGRDLRGLWYSPDETMHDPTKTTTQDSEEWTQARSSTLGLSRSSLGPAGRADSSSHPSGTHSSMSSHPFSDTESGWSSQAISDWAAGASDELLLPKACGSNNLIFKRLHSRGFIKEVLLRGASSKDIQSTLAHAFNDLPEDLKYSDKDEASMLNSYPGLRASFIPLRKVAKESKLHFLTTAEMSSSALWTAQFLASGILMRVTGHKRRLYVTSREGYIQSRDQPGNSWTWQELRQLPRFTADQDLQMEGNEEDHQPQVAEADAKEACWAYHEACDAPPPSVNSSFGSHHSLQLSMRPADRSWRRSMTPTSILKNRQPQPLSPLSEFHPRPARNRIVSASLVEPAISSSAKRRLNSSPVKQSSAPQASSRAPSVSMTRLKRRRVSSSSSSQPDTGEREAQVAIWANTPRRSREPPSPFYSSHPQLPRTNSDLASRPSQRSLAAASKSAPFAYATPHSGPFVGDTEPDEDVYQDDDGEQSWRGVTTGDDDSGSEDDAEVGVEDEPASFSGDNSVLGTEDDVDDESSEEGDHFGAQHLEEDEDENDDEDVLDSLLQLVDY